MVFPVSLGFCSSRMGLLLISLVLSPQVAKAELRFFAFGDLPYSRSETEMLVSLLAEVERGKPQFLVHVGDVKGGSSPCTGRALRHVADIFEAQSVPVLYTPGDNEWTDCHREGAGGYDPLERLEVVRSVYFGDSDVLRLSEIGVTHTDAAYPENYWFIREGVLFVTLHLVGSHNNSVPGDAVAAAELQARSHANRRHLKDAMEAASAVDAVAFVLLFHGNPGLERKQAPRGFHWFHEDLRALLHGFSGPVLAIHGDTHKYKFDHPLRDFRTGRVIERFTRLEVPGSPKVAGVWVRLAPGDEVPVSVELLYPDVLEPLVE